MFLLLFPLLFQEDSIPSLLERLASDRVEERDEASRRLKLRAVEAEGALEEASRSADPEVAARAGEILEVLVAYRKEIARELFLVLNQARFEFDEGHFAHCVRLCDAALELAPGLAPVEELRRDARAGCWRPDHGEVGQTIDLRWIRLPRLEVWRVLKARIREDVPGDEDPLPINRKLATMKIDLAFEDTTLEDILAFIRDFSGLNLLLDARLQETIDPSRKMDFKVKDQTLGKVLGCLLAELGLVYVVTEEKVVLLTTPRLAAGGR